MLYIMSITIILLLICVLGNQGTISRGQQIISDNQRKILSKIKENNNGTEGI